MIAHLDESVPARLAKALAGLGCRALRFPNAWKGLKNGELLARLAAQGASCLITCDKNLKYQRSISRSGLAVIVLPRQRFPDLEPICPSIAQAVAQAKPGDVLIIGADGSLVKE